MYIEMISSDAELTGFVHRIAGRMDSASVICCFIAFLLYYNTLDAGFVYDDRWVIDSSSLLVYHCHLIVIREYNHHNSIPVPENVQNEWIEILFENVCRQKC